MDPEAIQTAECEVPQLSGVDFDWQALGEGACDDADVRKAYDSLVSSYLPFSPTLLAAAWRVLELRCQTATWD